MSDSATSPNPTKLPGTQPTRRTAAGADDGMGGRMSFMDHLLELRRRLWWAALSIAVMVVLSLVFYVDLFQFMRRPLDQINLEYATDPTYLAYLEKQGLPPVTPIARLVSTSVLDTIMTVMWLGLGAGLVLSSPVLLYELYAFVAPGLKETEKRAIRPILFGGIFFFLIGAALAYFVLYPATIRFSVWFNMTLELDVIWSVNDYLSLLLTMMFMAGLIWEVPLVVAVLARLELVPAAMLLKYWRPCVLISFVLGSVLSPGSDVLAMLIFSAMLLALYVLSIGMALIFYPRKKSET